MLYCLNPQCPKPLNSDSGKFCVSCGQKLLLGDRYVGVKLIQQGEKGRTILGIDRGTIPESYCIIKQVILTSSVMNPVFIAEFEQNIIQFKKLGDRREFPRVLDYFIPSNFQNLSIPPMVIFEKIEGESLRQKLTDQGRFLESEVKDFLMQILPLVQAIHDQGIVHRDLNPENILFTPEKYWAIVDFTAAKATSKVANFQQGTLIGSGIYTAPEQLRGKTYPASDLYSLGVICLELLTGIHPFDLYSSQGDEWVWRDYLTTPVSDSFAKLLNQMIAERVGDRPPSANAVLETLGIKFHAPKQPIYAPPIVVIESQFKSPISLNKEQLLPQWHCFHTLKGHTGYLTDLLFDASVKFLASAAADQTVRIWDCFGRHEWHCLRGHKSIVSNVVFQGDRLISGGWDYSIRLWDWQRGIETQRLQANQTWIYNLILNSDQTKLATLGADHQITFWDIETLKPCEIWDSQAAQLIRFYSKTDHLISANIADLCIWENKTIVKKLTDHSEQITDFRVSSNGKFLISAAADKTIKIWSLVSQSCDKTFNRLNPVKTLAIFPNHRFFCAGDDLGFLHIWQLGQHHPTVSLSGHQGEIKAIAISPDSQIIATGGQDKTIKLWRFGIQ